ncbi:MAG: hypothetical protein RJQ04_04220 [Longimicrobiales bacterium]
MPSETTSEPWRPEPPEPPRHVVGQAIQDSTAPRLGRAFVPVGLLFAAGLGQALAGRGPTPWALLLGAPAAALAMLAFGLRIVQLAFGRPYRAWMGGAMAASVIPPFFSVYVLGWLGLRRIATLGGPLEVLAGAAFAALGVWVLRAWMRIVEVQRLADVMLAPGGAGAAGGAR